MIFHGWIAICLLFKFCEIHLKSTTRQKQYQDQMEVRLCRRSKHRRGSLFMAYCAFAEACQNAGSRCHELLLDPRVPVRAPFPEGRAIAEQRRAAAAAAPVRTRPKTGGSAQNREPTAAPRRHRGGSRVAARQVRSLTTAQDLANVGGVALEPTNPLFGAATARELVTANRPRTDDEIAEVAAKAAVKIHDALKGNATGEFADAYASAADDIARPGVEVVRRESVGIKRAPPSTKEERTHEWSSLRAAVATANAASRLVGQGPR